MEGKFIMGDFPRIPIRNYFYMSCFIFADSILRTEMLRVIVLGGFLPGLNCLKDVSVERRFFLVGGARFSGII